MAVKTNKGEQEIILLPAPYGVSYRGSDYFEGDIFTVDDATAKRLVHAGQAREATEEDKAAAAKKSKR
jgi:hypothetical protein